ncbi:MAG TPA: PQQ-binding-like beta-propeller repeat protein [Amycolatopsis sp.]|nr:PQQ-binding-like beta-propeller repeat protein [Amycolatopsis sp.]
MVSKTVSALAMVLVAGCASTSAAEQPSGPPQIPARQLAAGDWPTYHRDNARTGTAPDLAPLGTLAVAWHARLDGAVYGQPLVVGDRILAATENDTVYSLDAATGAVRWQAHVGEPIRLSQLPCGNIDPLGITSTMVFDPATSRVYALAEMTAGRHQLVGVNSATGAVEVRTTLEPPRGTPLAHQQRAALTLLGNRIYVAYGGLFGDCGNYIGSVVSVTTAGASPLSFSVPTTREAGIWAPGGAAVDGQRLLYSVGNGASTSSYDGSDSTVALTPQLTQADLFAPSTWASDNAADRDLGSASPTLIGTQVLAVGKSGTGYVLRHDRLGGVGGQVAQATICRSFGGSAVDGTTAYVPCTDGTRAVRIAANGTPTVAWRAAVSANGSPTVGGGVVWVTNYTTGVLFALNPANGAVRAQLTVGALPHFASPTLSGTHAYLGAMDGVVAVSGA